MFIVQLHLFQYDLQQAAVGAKRTDVREEGPNENREDVELTGTVEEETDPLTEPLESEQTGTVEEETDPLTEPHQPNPKFIEVQKLANRTLTFQENWFKDFPWLHYCPRLKGVLCIFIAPKPFRSKHLH